MQPKNREEKKEIILHTTISYNHFQNILRLFDVLPNFYFHHKWNDTCLLINMEKYVLPHDFPNDLHDLRILENIRQMSKLDRMIA